MAALKMVKCDLSGAIIAKDSAALVTVYIGAETFVLDASVEEARKLAERGRPIARRGRRAKTPGLPASVAEHRR
jgi:hypothetical protein